MSNPSSLGSTRALSPPKTAPFPLRKAAFKRAWWALGEFASALRERRIRSAIRDLRGAYAGQHLIIAGSGPSMRNLPLHLIAGHTTLLMTVNKSYQLFPDTRIDFHTISDRHCYASFAEQIEAQDFGTCFYRDQIARLPAWQQFGQPERTVFVPSRRGGIQKRGVQVRADRGIGNDSSVVVFAAQLAFHLGFDPVTIIGCDLAYDGPELYAYDIDDGDRRHECTPETQARRLSMVHANAEFKALRDVFEAHDRVLRNATPGGSLEALPRVAFADTLS
ncbi:MAG: hypothetical protein AAF732_15145 [Pseudomonadota bacterium]